MDTRNAQLSFLSFFFFCTDLNSYRRRGYQRLDTYIFQLIYVH